MAIVNALEAICDLLPYFAVVSLFSAYSDAWAVIGVVLLLTALSSLITEKTNAVPVRIACGILPALALLAARSTAQILFTAPAALLWLVIVLSGKTKIHYEDYKYWFGFPALFALILLLVNLSRYLSDLPISPISVICSASYLFLGVCVLRRKRSGAGANLSSKLMNAAELIVSALFGVLALAAFLLALKVLWKLFEILFLPGGLILSAVGGLLGWLAGIFNIEQNEEPTPPETDFESGPAVVDPAETVADTVAKDYSSAETLQQIIAYVMIVAAIAAIVFLAYYAVKKLRAARYAKDPNYEVTLRERRIKAKSAKKKWRREPTNNDMIRSIYREYLSYIRHSGVKIAMQTTSEEALNASKKLAESEEAEELRLLYIRARYDEKEEMSDEEVRSAKELWGVIRKEYEAEKMRNIK